MVKYEKVSNSQITIFLLFSAISIFATNIKAIGNSELASASKDKTIKIWNINNPKKPRLIETLSDNQKINSIAFSNINKNILAYLNEANEIKICDLLNKEGKKCTSIIPSNIANNNGLKSIFFLPMAKKDTLICAHLNGLIEFYDLSDETKPILISTIQDANQSEIVSLSISPLEAKIAASFFDKTVKIWNISDAKKPVLIKNINNLTSTVIAIAFSYFDKNIIAISCIEEVKIFDISQQNDKELLSSLPSKFSSIVSLTFNNFNKKIACAHTGGEIEIFDLSDPKKPTLIKTIKDANAKKIIFSNTNQKILISSSGQNVINIFDISKPEGKELLSSITNHKEFISDLKFAPILGTKDKKNFQQKLIEQSKKSRLHDVNIRTIN